MITISYLYGLHRLPFVNFILRFGRTTSMPMPVTVSQIGKGNFLDTAFVDGQYECWEYY